MGVYVAIKSAGPAHEKYLSIVENYRDSSGKKSKEQSSRLENLRNCRKKIRK